MPFCDISIPYSYPYYVTVFYVMLCYVIVHPLSRHRRTRSDAVRCFPAVFGPLSYVTQRAHGAVIPGWNPYSNRALFMTDLSLIQNLCMDACMHATFAQCMHFTTEKKTRVGWVFGGPAQCTGAPRCIAVRSQNQKNFLRETFHLPDYQQP